MPGVKGKSGGSKPGSRPNNGGGGRSQGRLPQKIEIRLSKSASQELRILARIGGGAVNGTSLQNVVEAYIHEKWMEYDESIQQAVEKMEEFIL